MIPPEIRESSTDVTNFLRCTCVLTGDLRQFALLVLIPSLHNKGFKQNVLQQIPGNSLFLAMYRVLQGNVLSFKDQIICQL